MSEPLPLRVRVDEQAYDDYELVLQGAASGLAGGVSADFAFGLQREHAVAPNLSPDGWRREPHWFSTPSARVDHGDLVVFAPGDLFGAVDDFEIVTAVVRDTEIEARGGWDPKPGPIVRPSAQSTSGSVSLRTAPAPSGPTAPEPPVEAEPLSLRKPEPESERSPLLEPAPPPQAKDAYRPEPSSPTPPIEPASEPDPWPAPPASRQAPLDRSTVIAIVGVVIGLIIVAVAYFFALQEPMPGANASLPAQPGERPIVATRSA